MKRRGAVMLVGLLVAVLLAAVAYSQSQANRPQVILETALANSFSAESVAFALAMRQGLPAAPADRLELSGRIIFDGRFDITGNYYRGSQSVGIDVRSPQGSDAHLRLVHMDVLADLLGDEAADYGITNTRNPLKALDGRWLTVPAGIKDTVLQGGSAGGPEGLQSGDRRRLAELYQAHRFLTVERRLADEAINGVDSYHYRVGIDDGKLERFMQAVRKDVPRLPLTDSRARSLQAALGQADRLEIWIGKADRQPRQLGYHSYAYGRIKDIQLTLTGFDAAGPIETPPGTIPLFEALQNINSSQSR